MSSTGEIQPAPDPDGSGRSAPFEARAIFVGPQGVRSGWRFLIYIAISMVILFASLAALSRIPTFRDTMIAANTGRLSAQSVIFLEFPQALAFVLAAVVMSVIEKRPFGQYGMPLREAFGARFWEGMLWGVGSISFLMGAIAVFKGYSFGQIALSRHDMFANGGAYLLGFLLVGFTEEFSFRGYSQYTVASGMGFWPAAGVLSGAFGAVHLGNKGEGIVGAASVVAIGLFFCLTLKRTGNLWFAIGLHCSFDWGETFLYSVPNSGNVADGSLSRAIIHGPRWLTGGSVGPEGSVFCFIMVAMMFVIFHFLHPAKPE